MKKRNLVTKVMLVILFITIALFICNKVESIIVRKGTIVGRHGNELTIWDNTGNEWNYVTKEEEFKDNQRVEVIINNNRTIDNLDDDVIIKIKKIK